MPFYPFAADHGTASALPQQPICAANHDPGGGGDAGQDDISALHHARDVCLELGLIVQTFGKIVSGLSTPRKGRRAGSQPSLTLKTSSRSAGTATLTSSPQAL